MNSKQLNNYDFEEINEQISLEGIDRIVRGFKRLLLACLLFLLLVSILAVNIQRKTIEMLVDKPLTETTARILE